MCTTLSSPTQPPLCWSLLDGGGNGDVLNGAVNTSLSNRRRVSFNPLVVHDNAVPDVAGGAAIQTQPQNTGNAGIQPSPGTAITNYPSIELCCN